METTPNRPAYRFLGTCDDVTECDLCGRADLKSTVALQPLTDGSPDGEVVYFGCDCAARALGWTQRAVKVAAKSADDERRAAAREAYQARYSAHPAVIAMRAEREAYKAAHGGLLAGFPMDRIHACNAIVAAVEAELGPRPY